MRVDQYSFPGNMLREQQHPQFHIPSHAIGGQVMLKK
jgi:hypothetical protein